MGVSVHPKLIVGIKSTLIASEETIEDTFEVHDQRGNPTGKFKTEYVKHIKTTVEGIEKKVKDDGYVETITDLLGLEEYPDENVFGFHQTTYETTDYLEHGIVGICIIAQGDVFYGDSCDNLPLADVVKASQTVKERVKAIFGIECEPEVFLVTDVG